MRLATDLATIPAATAAHWLDRDAEPSDQGDRRFADPAWTTNPFFCATRLAYLAASRFARDVVAGAALEPDVVRKAALATDLLLGAAAPTNLLALNPGA
jgi:polyhydroxyalkanoate synthase